PAGAQNHRSEPLDEGRESVLIAARGESLQELNVAQPGEAARREEAVQVLEGGRLLSARHVARSSPVPMFRPSRSALPAPILTRFLKKTPSNHWAGGGPGEFAALTLQAAGAIGIITRCAARRAAF